MWANRLPLPIEAAYAKRRCVVCGAPIGADVHDSHACRLPTCRAQLAALRSGPPELVRLPVSLPRCTVCRWPLTPDEARRARNVCSIPACREEAKQREELARAEKEAAREGRKAELHAWGIANLGLGADARERTRLVVVPAQPQIMEPMTEEQREAFVAHVKEVTELAFSRAPSRDAVEATGPDDARIGRLRDLGCATCKGHCCAGGAKHAFLDEEEVARLRAARPGIKPRDVEAYYLDALPEVSVRGSCPYSTEGGCALGEKRSRWCKGYHCPPLVEIGSSLPEGTRALVVAIEIERPLWYTSEDWPGEGEEPARASVDDGD